MCRMDRKTGSVDSASPTMTTKPTQLSLPCKEEYLHNLDLKPENRTQITTRAMRCMRAALNNCQLLELAFRICKTRLCSDPGKGDDRIPLDDRNRTCCAMTQPQLRLS